MAETSFHSPASYKWNVYGPSITLKLSAKSWNKLKVSEDFGTKVAGGNYEHQSWPINGIQLTGRSARNNEHFPICLSHSEQGVRF